MITKHLRLKSALVGDRGVVGGGAAIAVPGDVHRLAIRADSHRAGIVDAVSVVVGLAHSWVPGAASARDALADSARTARGTREDMPAALAAVNPTVVTATAAAVATHARATYLYI